ncbi:facilitated trehalose transporter Tret1-like isoform X2 [Cimex lectularius]|uniref:Major facilitator superfamily (MFS) profile domain-containing protein n=1 Tax=Cimex lectularius TaxID=79782 RepID=A0A8I6RNI0_CIMLE|nr:facilitated trehalose transporter Tret1-like isoform X2 [Cimex lectularius]
MDSNVEEGKVPVEDGRPSSHLRQQNILAQVSASFSKYIIMLDIGMAICYSTIAIPPILDAAEGLSINKSQASWFASLVFVWQPVGSLASVPMSGLGRKRLMFYLQVPLFIGWIMPYFATTVWELYLASSFLGLGIGFMQAPIATYIGEVTQPQYRGWLASIAYCFLTLGNVAIYVIDIPESPVWLVSKRRYDDAKKSLKWLRGWTSDEEVEEEFHTILYNNCKHYASFFDSQKIDPKSFPIANIPEEYRKHCQQTTEEIANIQNGEQVQVMEEEKPFLKYLLEPEMYKPIILSLVFFYMSNGISIAVFRSYLVLIFKEFKVEMDEYIILVGVTTIGLVANIVCVIIMPLIKKRRLTFLAGIACTLGVFSLGFYVLFGEHLNQKWIPIAIMVELFFATNLAIGHLPWILISEIFPLRGRSFASGLVAGIANFMQFLGTKLFWTYVSWMTLGGTFIMYGFVFVIGLTYLYFFQVETEGRSLDEIVCEFKYGKKYHSSMRRDQTKLR